MLRKIVRAAAHPVWTSYRLRGEFFPGGLRERMQRLARSQGFRRCYFLLSFDCDTDRDLEVTERVHERLGEVGITPVYAVPGELLERGREVYRRLAATGAEFLNHGYRTHTVLDRVRQRYVSTLFYDRMTLADVEQDIQRGHAAVHDVLGRTPLGFRTPHFGTFCQPAQLRYVHQVLASLGYTFSSSSVPLFGLQRGPAPRLESGLYEVPLTGCYDHPLHMLDSWGFRFDPNRRRTEADLVDQCRKLATYFLGGLRVGLINIYADPSQVHDWPGFFEAMSLFSGVSVGSFHKVIAGIRS